MCYDYYLHEHEMSNGAHMVALIVGSQNFPSHAHAHIISDIAECNLNWWLVLIFKQIQIVRKGLRVVHVVNVKISSIVLVNVM